MPPLNDLNARVPLPPFLPLHPPLLAGELRRDLRGKAYKYYRVASFTFFSTLGRDETAQKGDARRRANTWIFFFVNITRPPLDSLSITFERYFEKNVVASSRCCYCRCLAFETRLNFVREKNNRGSGGERRSLRDGAGAIVENAASS